MKYAISNGGVYFLFFLDAKIRILLFSFLMEIVEYEERSRKIE